MPKKASRTKQVKENDASKTALDRFTPVIIPKKMSKQIKPEAIFDGYSKPAVTKKGPKVKKVQP